MSLVFGYSQLRYEPEQNPLKKLERPSYVKIETVALVQGAEFGVLIGLQNFYNYALVLRCRGNAS